MLAWVLVADDVDYYRSSREVVIEVPEQPMAADPWVRCYSMG